MAARLAAFKDRADFKAILNCGGVIGSLISVLCDWLSPTKTNETKEKIDILNDKLTALGTNMTGSSSAVGEKVDQAAIDEKMSAFKETLLNCESKYTSLDSDLQVEGISMQDLVNNPDQEKVKKAADIYKKLYSSPDFGVDELNGKVNEKSENTENFIKLCQFGTAITSANRYKNDIFQLFADYESLKEYFNTSTFASRDTFEELVMSVYSACLDQMQTAILFDYYRVEGQIKYITENKDTKADDFDDKFPLTSSLLDKLKLAARNDLYRLGFDTVTAGHESYEINDYINNKWVLASDPTNTKVKNIYNTLSSNAKAVNYAFANSVENKPVKTFVRFNPNYKSYLVKKEDYEKQLSNYDAQLSALYSEIDRLTEKFQEEGKNLDGKDWDKLHEEYEIKVNEISSKRDEIRYNRKAVFKEYSDFLDNSDVNKDNQMNEYEDRVIKSPDGVELQGKLKNEEKISKNTALMYSYRNKSWIYNSLDGQNFQTGVSVGVPMWYMAKYLANKYGLKDIKALDTCDAAKRIWDNNHPLNNAEWNKILDHLPVKTLNPSSDFLSVLNTNAQAKGLHGVNELLKLNETHEVTVEHKDGKGATTSTEKITIPGFDTYYESDRIASVNYNLLGSEAHQPSYAPTFQINLGYYKNNMYHNPDKSDKTFYQNLHTSSAADYTFNEEAYDKKIANFITVPHDGDDTLDGLGNGKKVPEKPETDVENDI